MGIDPKAKIAGLPMLRVGALKQIAGRLDRQRPGVLRLTVEGAAVLAALQQRAS
jgi:hypothetical protein